MTYTQLTQADLLQARAAPGRFKRERALADPQLDEPAAKHGQSLERVDRVR
ncbi:MAG: hypothetical protein ABJA84_02535 [Polaromonas sp.]